MKTQLLVLDGVNAPLQMREVELAEPEADELLVKMVASGICHSDLGVVDGTLPGQFPAVLGHEGAGIVEQVGANLNNRFSVGDQVLLSFDFCGTCKGCSKDASASCTSWLPNNFLPQRKNGTASIGKEVKSGKDVNGKFFGQSSFSQHMLVSANSAVKVAKDLDLRYLAPLGCGVQTGAGAVLNVLKPKPDESIGVFGLGGVGMAAIIAAKALNVQTIVAIDLVEERRQLALELGATHALDGKASDIIEQITKITNVAMLDYVVEATGNGRVLKTAYNSLGVGGVHAQVGAFKVGSYPEIDLQRMSTHQITFRGILEGNSHPPKFIPELIDLYQQGKLPMEKISKLYKFEEFEEAIRAMKAGEVIKPILIF